MQIGRHLNAHEVRCCRLAGTKHAAQAQTLAESVDMDARRIAQVFAADTAWLCVDRRDDARFDSCAIGELDNHDSFPLDVLAKYRFMDLSYTIRPGLARMKAFKSIEACGVETPNFFSI